ncbi:hypothetical protein E2C01_024901 [Portunus trituberculatus]|uniref:Uncharacterized protein n=1 Tax=Portunus trituberculatus TaxID=210409 RepID=A0A5B7EE58_PORTR|nr:hypothetical protein [Portunus trituberculatus]
MDGTGSIKPYAVQVPREVPVTLTDSGAGTLAGTQSPQQMHTTDTGVLSVGKEVTTPGRKQVVTERGRKKQSVTTA